ncbi:MAG: glycosyltransferase family 39 protein [Planctomycetia bacterium]|nr:glycosyltransferase family 39 protein [Planctomycetia bacterium]
MSGTFKILESQKIPWKMLMWILGLGLILRCAILVIFGGETLEIVDETHYNALAVELAQSGLYMTPGEGLVSIRPPLYPWVLSVIYKIFGLENYTAVRIFQIFISLLTTLVVYGLAREWDGFLTSRGALWTAALFCFYPSLVAENYLLLTETLFTFWLVLVLWTASRFLRTGSIYAAAFCGVFIAFGALTRSILWLSPIPLAVFFMIFAGWKFTSVTQETYGSRRIYDPRDTQDLHNTHFTWKQRVFGAFLLLIFAGVGMAPWIIRNTRLQETFTPIDCMSGRNLMMGNYEFTPFYRAWDAISAQPPYDWYTVLDKAVYEKDGLDLDPLTQGEKDRLASAYVKDFIKKNPGLTLKRDLMKALCFWQLERSTLAGVAQGFWGFDQIPTGTPRQVALVALAGTILLPYVSMFALATLGVCILRYRASFLPIVALMLAVILYFWLLHTLAFAHERYHLPLIPILILFAVYAVENFHGTRKYLSQNSFRLTIFSLILAIFGIFWICEIWWAMKSGGM